MRFRPVSQTSDIPVSQFVKHVKAFTASNTDGHLLKGLQTDSNKDSPKMALVNRIGYREQ